MAKAKNKNKAQLMSQVLSYFQSVNDESYGTVIHITTTPDGHCLVSFPDDSNKQKTVSLKDFRVTEINEANRQHFEMRHNNFIQSRKSNS